MTTNPTVQPLTYHCPHCNATIEAKPTHADEVVICPACSQAFKLELPSAKPDEPHNGIVLPQGVDTPVEATAPAAIPIGDSPESAGETFHVSMWRRYPARCMGYILGVLGALVVAIWLLQINLPWMALLAGIGAAYLVLRIAAWWLRMRNTTLTITDRRCIVETGVFSRQATEIGRSDIVDVQVAQGTLQRLFNVGDLVIVADKGSKKELVLMAVPDPETVVRKITDRPTPQAELVAPAQPTSAA